MLTFNFNDIFNLKWQGHISNRTLHWTIIFMVGRFLCDSDWIPKGHAKSLTQHFFDEMVQCQSIATLARDARSIYIFMSNVGKSKTNHFHDDKNADPILNLLIYIHKWTRCIFCNLKGGNASEPKIAAKKHPISIAQNVGCPNFRLSSPAVRSMISPLPLWKVSASPQKTMGEEIWTVFLLTPSFLSLVRSELNRESNLNACLVSASGVIMESFHVSWVRRRDKGGRFELSFLTKRWAIAGKTWTDVYPWHISGWQHSEQCADKSILAGSVKVSLNSGDPWGSKRKLMWA